MILGLKNMFTYTYATTVTPEEYAIANGVRHAVIVPSVWSYARSENTRLAGGRHTAAMHGFSYAFVATCVLPS